MKLQYSFESGIALVQLAGTYTTADVRDTVMALLDDPACPDRPSMLMDLRASQVIQNRSGADMQEVARSLALIGSKIGRRFAMVAGSEAAYGLLRLGSVYAAQAGVEPAVFRDLASARAWLLAD